MTNSNVTGRNDGCDGFAFVSSTIILSISIVYLLVFALSAIVTNFWKLWKYWDNRKQYRLARMSTKCLLYNSAKLEKMVIKEYESVIATLRRPAVGQAQTDEKDEDSVDALAFAKYIYPTISDSIADANSIERRIFNVLTATCIMIIMFNLWYEYASFSVKLRNATLAYYILEVLCLLFLVMVPLFPNTGIRLHPPWFRDVSNVLSRRKQMRITFFSSFCLSPTVFIFRLQSFHFFSTHS